MIKINFEKVISFMNDVAEKELKMDKAKFGRCVVCKKELKEYERYAQDEHFKKYCIVCAKDSPKFVWVKNWN